MSSDRRARLAGTFARYADEVRGRAAAIAGLLADGDAAAIRTLLLHAHTLAGSGATMEAEDIGTLGHALEDIALRLIGAGRAPDCGERAEMVALSERLTQAVAAFDPEAGLDTFLARIYPQG